MDGGGGHGVHHLLCHGGGQRPQALGEGRPGGGRARGLGHAPQDRIHQRQKVRGLLLQHETRGGGAQPVRPIERGHQGLSGLPPGRKQVVVQSGDPFAEVLRRLLGTGNGPQPQVLRDRPLPLGLAEEAQERRDEDVVEAPVPRRFGVGVGAVRALPNRAPVGGQREEPVEMERERGGHRQGERAERPPAEHGVGVGLLQEAEGECRAGHWDQRHVRPPRDAGLRRNGPAAGVPAPDPLHHPPLRPRGGGHAAGP
mmetsp:Transcript_54012/g.89972  ORF Transcript_54012/g.89972 Transcript_54012/m.89972 type:complete len:255 (+) Transcript_54012:661-1425(+)